MSGAHSGEGYGVRVDKQYFNFGSAHFLIFADGTREALHGHNYHVSVEVEGQRGLGGLVVDFTPLKPVVKAICDDLDHVVLLPRDNPRLEIRREGGSVAAIFGAERFVFPEVDVRVLPVSNTSTECLARYIACALRQELGEHFPGAELHRLRVIVSESPGQAGWYTCALD